MSEGSYDYTAHDIGRLAGWDAANFAEAYGTQEPAEDEAARRAAEQSGYEPRAWETGFIEGWERFLEGMYPDGTPTFDEGADGT